MLHWRQCCLHEKNLAIFESNIAFCPSVVLNVKSAMDNYCLRLRHSFLGWIPEPELTDEMSDSVNAAELDTLPLLLEIRKLLSERDWVKCKCSSSHVRRTLCVEAARWSHFFRWLFTLSILALISLWRYSHWTVVALSSISTTSRHSGASFLPLPAGIFFITVYWSQCYQVDLH